TCKIFLRKKTIVHIEFIFQPYTDAKEEIGRSESI
ncbi:hypothetical protein W555_01789, partial [Staphylococcus aureus VET0289R]